MLGRVVDGSAKPIDGLGPIRGADHWPLAGKMQSPLDRGRVLEPMDVGVRAINGLLTIGQGQRVGIMAGSGVGKSVLLGMMVRAARADVIVIGLIGERSAKSPTSSKPRSLARRAPARSWSRCPPTIRRAAYPRRAARHRHCRGVPRRGQEGPAHHGFADPRRPCGPRDRAGAGRAASARAIRPRHRDAAQPDRAGGRRCARHRIDHRHLYGAGRRRRRQ